MSAPTVPTIRVVPEVLFGNTIVAWYQTDANTSSMTITCPGTGGSTAIVPVVDNVPYTQSFSNLSPGEKYTLSIQANNENGSSAIQYYTPVTVGSLPSIPQNLTGVIVGSNDILLNWNFSASNGSSPIGWYGIEISNTGALSNVQHFISSHRIFNSASGNYTYNVYAINDAGWGPSASVTVFGGFPAEPTLWLDASSTNNFILSGSTVDRWTDKSGNGYHATQNGSSRPTLSGTSVFFDGSDDFMNLNLDFLANTNHQAFIIIKAYSFNGNIYGAANGSANQNSLHIGFNGASSYRVNYWGNDFGPNITSNFRNGQFNLVTYEWKANVSKKVFANGKIEGALIDSAVGVIGTMSGGGRLLNVVAQGYLQCEIKEIVFFTGAAVTDANRATTEALLMNKWGITPA